MSNLIVTTESGRKNEIINNMDGTYTANLNGITVRVEGEEKPVREASSLFYKIVEVETQDEEDENNTVISYNVLGEDDSVLAIAETVDQCETFIKK